MVATRYSGVTRAVRRPGRPWRNVDLVLLASVLCVSAVGVLMVYSSTRQKQLAAGLDPEHYFKRQLLFVALGLIALVVSVSFDYRWLRDVAPVVWIGTIVLLLGVLTPLGTSQRGTQAWYRLGLFHFEPAEASKVALIVVLSAYLAVHRGAVDTPHIVTSLILTAVPMGLIFLQPDVGSGMVYVAIIMGVLLVAGARPRHITALTALGVAGIIVILHLGMLKEYQLDRLSAFLDPAGDTQRSAYNLRQSQIAIAAGGLTGRGVFQGTQTNLSFVPEQHTDFIFTAVGEELGFLGAATLLTLYGLILWRIWRAAALAKDEFGTLLCVGVLSMLLFQIFENVGMTMGITPIAGIPLPFLSYGGSALVSCFFAIGLVLNVTMRRYG